MVWPIMRGGSRKRANRRAAVDGKSMESNRRPTSHTGSAADYCCEIASLTMSAVSSTFRAHSMEQGRPGGDRLTGAAAVHDTTAGCAGPHLPATADRDRSAGQDGGSLRRTASAGAPVDDASWRGPDHGTGLRADPSLDYSLILLAKEERML